MIGEALHFWGLFDYRSVFRGGFAPIPRPEETHQKISWGALHLPHPGCILLHCLLFHRYGVPVACPLLHTVIRRPGSGKSGRMKENPVTRPVFYRFIKMEICQFCIALIFCIQAKHDLTCLYSSHGLSSDHTEDASAQTVHHSLNQRYSWSQKSQCQDS